MARSIGTSDRIREGRAQKFLQPDHVERIYRYENGEIIENLMPCVEEALADQKEAGPSADKPGYARRKSSGSSEWELNEASLDK